MKSVRLLAVSIWSISLVLWMPAIAEAKELAGVQISEKISIDGVDQPLVLNGVGIRYKLFFKIYIAALYLPQPQSDGAMVVSANQPGRMMMHILYDEVPLKKLVSAWNEGFEDNLNEKQLAALKPRIEQFNQMFSDLHEGDQVLLDFVPPRGTRITIKGVEKGWISGADFQSALLAIWLGEDPVTEELQQALLGLEEE